eukprot:12630763-Alexandrium_andersonii.AAC.1
MPPDGCPAQPGASLKATAPSSAHWHPFELSCAPQGSLHEAGARPAVEQTRWSPEFQMLCSAR